MTLARTVAAATAIAVTLSLAVPQPVQGLSEGAEIAVYVLIGIAAFTGIVIVGTLLTRDEAKLYVGEDAIEPEAPEGVAFGMACRSPAGRPVLVCW